MRNTLLKGLTAFAITLGVPSAALASDPAEVQADYVTSSDGTPIAYSHWGNMDGPPVVLIHGLLASTLNWKKQIEDTELDKFHMIAFDMRGHGSSGKPITQDAYSDPKLWAHDLHAVLDELGVEKPVLVGHSFGAYVAMDYIREYGSDSVAGVVIAGANAGLMPPPPPAEPAPQSTDQKKKNVAANISPNLFVNNGWVDGYLTGFVGKSGPMDPKDFEMFKVSVQMAPGYIRNFLRARDSNTNDVLPMLTMPVMIEVGTEDPAVKMEDIDWLMERIPNATLHTYDGLANTLPWYAPGRFNMNVANFVNQVSN